MKKKLFFGSIMIAGQLYSLNQDSMRRLDSVKPLLSAHQMLNSKVDLFCQSAIHAFGAEGMITIAQVLTYLEQLEEQGSHKEIQFADADEFLSWVTVQKKTILVLYDQANIKSAICLQYLEYLSQQSGFAVDWYAVNYDCLAPVLSSLKQAGNDTMLPTDVVPNAVFVINGQLWQIPEDLAAAGLKYWIDQYAMA